MKKPFHYLLLLLSLCACNSVEESPTQDNVLLSTPQLTPKLTPRLKPQLTTRRVIKTTPAPSVPRARMSQHTASPLVTHQVRSLSGANAQQRFHALAQGKNGVIRISQFGDSHSAADLFTGYLRKYWQRRYGDAGIGWIAPLSVRGQRHDRIRYQTEGWRLLDSRRDDSGDYAMGGFTAQAQEPRASIVLKPRKASDLNGQWRVNILARVNGIDGDSALTVIGSDQRSRLRVLKPQRQWQSLQMTTAFPETLVASGEGVEIGGLWLERADRKGVIVETIAANGAQNTWWDKWDKAEFNRDLRALSRSDIVILAYGTNEAFSSHFDFAQFKADLRARLQTLKRQLPSSLIIVLGAPESYQQFSQNRGKNCNRPAPLSAIQQAQASIARKEQVIFWDWQRALGGKCQVPNLVAQGLMQKDGIHFTQKGYEVSAQKFITYLEEKGIAP